MMDQVAIVRKHRFPTVMILPLHGHTTSRGVEVQNKSHGLRVANGHVWGLNHSIAWYVNCDGPSLTNCTGEGAQRAQLIVVGNDSVVMGGKFFAARPDRQSRPAAVQERSGTVPGAAVWAV